jgi:hypothetical protein
MPIRDIPLHCAGKKIVVVIPAYNEGPVLQLHDLREFL